MNISEGSQSGFNRYSENKGLMNKKKIKILSVIEKASGSIPIRYICAHCDMYDPFLITELLEELKKDGFIRCCPPNPWSLSLGPQYEITLKGRQELAAKLLR